MAGTTRAARSSRSCFASWYSRDTRTSASHRHSRSVVRSRKTAPAGLSDTSSRYGNRVVRAGRVVGTRRVFWASSSTRNVDPATSNESPSASSRSPSGVPSQSCPSPWLRSVAARSGPAGRRIAAPSPLPMCRWSSSSRCRVPAARSRRTQVPLGPSVTCRTRSATSVPSPSSSPCASLRAPATTAPLTVVPLVEPRSRTTTPSGPRCTTAWWPETWGSARTTWLPRSRPIVTASRTGMTRTTTPSRTSSSSVSTASPAAQCRTGVGVMVPAPAYTAPRQPRRRDP